MNLNRLFAALSLTGLVLALLAHGLALANVDAAAWLPWIWLLHGGCIALLLVFSVAGRRRFAPRRQARQFAAALPSAARYLLFALFLYLPINTLIFLHRTDGGSPAIEQGRYVLKDHGKLLRGLTASEYAAYRTNEIRGVSGLWLLLYYMPFAYFAWIAPRPPPRRAARLDMPAAAAQPATQTSATKNCIFIQVCRLATLGGTSPSGPGIIRPAARPAHRAERRRRHTENTE